RAAGRARASAARPSASSSTCRIAFASGGFSSRIACAERPSAISSTASSGDTTQVSHPAICSVMSMTSSSIASVSAPRSSGVSIGPSRDFVSERDLTGRTIARKERRVAHPRGNLTRPFDRSDAGGPAVSTLALTLAPQRSRASAGTAFQVACAVGGSVLVAGLAQLSFRLPFTPVPITGQTLGVLLVGAAFGPALGAATLVLYLAWGPIGVPVFAPSPDGSHDTGIEVLRATSLTGGYLVGFVAAAGLTGWLSRRGGGPSLRSSI